MFLTIKIVSVCHNIAHVYNNFYKPPIWIYHFICEYGIIYIFFFCLFLFFSIIIQPSMFRKDDVRVRFIDDDKNDDVINLEPPSNTNNDNPVGSIVAAIHKQRVKKTAALPKNTIADPAGVIIYEHVKLAGVKADSMKKIITLLANKENFDPKILSDVSQLIDKDVIEGLALLFNSYRGYIRRNVRNDTNKSLKLKRLDDEFKDISFKIMTSIPHIRLSSMGKEFHAMMCDADVNPFKAHKIIDSRFDILAQKLQHQIDDTYTLNNSAVCLPHNIMPPCRDKKCPLPHACSTCGGRDHIATDSRCPKFHYMKEWFLKRNIEINRYYQNKSKKPYRQNRNYDYPQSPHYDRRQNQNLPNNRYNNNRNNRDEKY